MQIYLLATNLFTLTALLFGLNFSRKSGAARLFPLFLLVISRSLALIISLARPLDFQTSGTFGIGALEVFSTFCVMWALTGSAVQLPAPWPRLAVVGTAAALILSILPLLPIWPIPAEIHSLTIALFGAPFVLRRLGELRWTHLTAPLLLALANFVSLLDLTSVFWLISLLAYVFFVNAIHWENIQTHYQLYRERQQAAEASVQEAIRQSHEQRRWFEASELINNVPNLSQSMEHVARTIANLTHADQTAIFMLDYNAENLARLVILHSPERPVHIAEPDGVLFDLDDCPPLKKAIDNQQQILLPQPEPGRQISQDLATLYRLWHEKRVGSTLIQPLLIEGHPIGAFMLGNPATDRSIRESDMRLCQALASQIATLVEHRRRYLELEAQAEAMITTRQTATSTVIATAAQSGESWADTIRRELEQSWETADFDEMGQNWELKTRKVAVTSWDAPETELEEGWDSLELNQLEQEWDASPPEVEEQGERGTVDKLSAHPGRKSTSGLGPISELEAHLAIFQAISNGIVVSDVAGRVQLVNQAAERILGKSARELIGQPIGTIYGDIDVNEPVEDLAVAFSRRNQPLPTFVEAEDRAIQGQLIPWRNDDYEWLGIIAVFRDVTREINADRARNDFIAALSRELRAPLTAIKGYSELIINGAISDYSAEQMQVQRIIHSSAERMIEVLDNAIQIMAENRHQLLPRFEETDVTEVINQALRDNMPLVQLRELRLAREVAPNIPPIAVDPDHLHRILDNLLSNACRFTPPGGFVTIRAWIQSKREHNAMRPYLVITVSDNGVGIPQSELKRIFNPFYQLDHHNIEALSGMGMGLTVVKELVELNNGRVWVESTVGEGSVFHLALPVSQGY